MRIETLFRKSASILLTACLAAFASVSFAGSLPAADRVIVAQAPTQDPKTPPDCKKYPKDVRCPVKK
jgi:hypothetical protein